VDAALDGGRAGPSREAAAAGHQDVDGTACRPAGQRGCAAPAIRRSHDRRTPDRTAWEKRGQGRRGNDPRRSPFRFGHSLALGQGRVDQGARPWQPSASPLPVGTALLALNPASGTSLTRPPPCAGHGRRRADLPPAFPERMRSRVEMRLFPEQTNRLSGKMWM
jgi:hypothetical protein